MTSATQTKLWLWQRASAAVLALLVVVHLALIVYAVRGGLTAAQILGRTRGSAAFAAFYALFVLACAVHVPIGLSTVAREWLRWRERSANAAALAIAALIAVAGLRAVYAVSVG
jgi:succinate dehydrogenase subunit C